jgi:hypothetical protein
LVFFELTEGIKMKPAGITGDKTTDVQVWGTPVFSILW